MTQPVRVQRSRHIKQVSPNGLPVKYVGRPSVWASPFNAGMTLGRDWHPYVIAAAARHRIPLNKPLTAAQAVTLYREYLEVNRISTFGLDVVRGMLRGKNLSDWARLDVPSHADVLLELANGGEQWE